MNSYAILGVPQHASSAEIKRAYRRLAMRWHPDRNSSPEATERFKQIRGAYDALLAVDGKNTSETASPPEPEVAPTPEPTPEPDVPKAADIRLNLEISLQEAASGCRKAIVYTRGNPCLICDGTGESGMARTRFCDNCHGSGRVHDAKRVLKPCRACTGRGFFTERICRACAGSGRDTASISLEVLVPAGMLPGDELRVGGQGEPASEGLLAGDLYLTIIISSHALFALRGRDLYFEMPVSALLMLAGGEIELPSLDGLVTHPLPASQPESGELRLVGKGYPGRGKNAPGDLVVHLQPVFPQKMNARQRKLLLQANASLLENAADCFPEIAAWREANGVD
ncbi:MAG: molecular chaperone DnaJ [Betaproteobacteria bacterium HGW-Betaproteobacteria-10]|nr:MAG: molecular chaperone DnaJ [Betaproteobacteria bacterium HGW-Betaproteobacteria-10]